LEGFRCRTLLGFEDASPSAVRPEDFGFVRFTASSESSSRREATTGETAMVLRVFFLDNDLRDS
jgi:hypothetical protein